MYKTYNIMNNSNRREFLQTAALLLSTAIAGSSFNLAKKKDVFSFSTLGCPDWSFEKIVDFAAEHNYSGIEIRGIKRELDLTKCNEFINTQNRLAAMRLMEDKELRFVDLGSSATLHFCRPG